MANLSNINGKFVVDTAGNIGVGTLVPRSDANTTNISIQSSGTARLFVNNTGASGKEYAIYSSANGDFGIFDYDAVSARLLINSAGNATFAGTVETTTLRTDVINNKANSANIIYRSGTSTLVGGGTTANKLYVLDNGNVGIGTTSPGSKLDVRGPGNFLGTAVSGAALVTIENNSGSTATSYGLLVKGGGNSSSGKTFEVRDDSGNTDLIVKGNGNVGIGTTSPDAKLEVESDQNSGFYSIFAKNISNGAGAFVSKKWLNDDAAFGEIWRNSSNRSSAGQQALSFNMYNSADINFWSGTTHTMALVGDNVGIGTDSPGYKLNVINNNTATWTARFTNNTNNVYLSVNDANNYGIYVSGETKNYFSGNVGIGTTSPAQKLHINGNVRVGTDTGFIDFARPGGAIVGGIGWHTDDYFYVAGHPTAGTGAGNNVRVYAFGSLLSLGNPTAGDALTVAVNGNIGIGVTSPAQKLQVSGNTYVTGYVQASSALIGLKDGYATLGSNSTATGIALSRDFLPSSYPDLIINSSGNVGIGITSPQDKLHVNGDAIISSTRFGDFSVANISTTGYAIATISASTNGQSAIVEFVASGNNGGYYNVVYSCYNGGGVWYYTKNVVGSGGNIEVAETNGAGSSTLVFYFRATSGTASYTPRVMMKGMPYNLVTF